jgi:transcriptional regulator with XRE-family HTH domain
MIVVNKNMNMIDIFSKNLTDLRKKARLTQVEMAKIIGITQGSYSGYESKRQVPSWEVIQKYADHFKIPFEWFFTDHSDNIESQPYERTEPTPASVAEHTVQWSFQSGVSPWPANNPHDAGLYYQIEIERLKSKNEELIKENKQLHDTLLKMWSVSAKINTSGKNITDITLEDL